MTREELVEAVAQAIANAWDSEGRIFEAADAAIALVLEEAAKVALGEYRRSSSGEEIASAIRALKEKSDE